MRLKCDVGYDLNYCLVQANEEVSRTGSEWLGSYDNSLDFWMTSSWSGLQLRLYVVWDLISLLLEVE